MKQRAVLTVILFFVMISPAWSQANRKESFSVSAGPEIAFPEGNFRSTHRIGFGLNIKGEYTFGKHLSATLNTGFLSMQGLSYFDPALLSSIKYKSLLAIPVKGGARYYMGNFYLLGEGGVIFLSNFAASTNGVISIGLGDKIKIGRNKLDISARQELWFAQPRNFNLAVIRIGYELRW